MVCGSSISLTHDETYQVLAGFQPQVVAVHLSQVHRRVHEPGVLCPSPGALADVPLVNVREVGIEPRVVGEVGRVGVEEHFFLDIKVSRTARVGTLGPGLCVSNFLRE